MPTATVDPHTCRRCGTINVSAYPHSFYGEPCDGTPRAPHVPSHEHEHDVIRHDAVAFARLPYIGSMPFEEAATGARLTLLLANCRECHSTISRLVAKDSDEARAYAAKAVRAAVLL